MCSVLSASSNASVQDCEVAGGGGIRCSGKAYTAKVQRLHKYRCTYTAAHIPLQYCYKSMNESVTSRRIKVFQVDESLSFCHVGAMLF